MNSALFHLIRFEIYIIHQGMGVNTNSSKHCYCSAKLELPKCKWIGGLPLAFIILSNQASAWLHQNVVCDHDDLMKGNGGIAMMVQDLMKAIKLCGDTCDGRPDRG